MSINLNLSLFLFIVPLAGVSANLKQRGHHVPLLRGLRHQQEVPAHSQELLRGRQEHTQGHEGMGRTNIIHFIFFKGNE